jgi:transcriptional regulator of acetoin/glycerol metabolism
MSADQREPTKASTPDTDPAGSGAAGTAASAQPTGAITLKDDDEQAQPSGNPVPGALLLFAEHKPLHQVFRLKEGALEIGRSSANQVSVKDALISRQHARLQRTGGGVWTVTDLDSRNGTFVQGQRVRQTAPVRALDVVRAGGALLVPCEDVRSFEENRTSIRSGEVLGPGTRAAFEAIARAVVFGGSLLVMGETGTGKELAARAFHRAGPYPRGPFIAVNCGAIPEGLAERLLFGSVRGAYSGASDAAGYVQAANSGTLFLDEVAELQLDVQVKLLRLLEAGEVTRLGAEHAEKVDVRVCAATWRDLRQEVSRRRFREDLYFRIGRPEVRLPPLRQRQIEIPWHIAHELDTLDQGIRASAAFVEACMLRPWPGNVRELRTETRRAASAAAATGRVSLALDDLDDQAGFELPSESSTLEKVVARKYPEDDVAAALRVERGNVVAAARRLGIHRNKVRRWLERHGVEARSFRKA